jgi:NAD(P)H-dependent flavin oxidoreductase YrpB (nitropropane dioxygenase family)
VIRTPVTDLPGIRYPIAQSTMRYVSGPSQVKEIP